MGVRSNSQEWLYMIKDYFENFFIPLIKREGNEGSFIMHCGDVFDSRHSMNLLVMNETLDIFEKISKIMPILIIVGNHDVFRKESNEINSLKVLKWLPNILIFEEPQSVQTKYAKLLMMPWRKSVEDEINCINNSYDDYVFCHTNVRGLKYNRYTEIETGIELVTLSKFKKVYSGHIHYAQSIENFRNLGCPYQMTRSDIGNTKGIWHINFEDNSERFFENNYSPKFMKILFEKVLEMEIEDINALFKNNFVDVLVDPKWSLIFPFSTFSDEIVDYKKLEFLPHLGKTVDLEDSETDSDVSLENFDIIKLTDRIIDAASYEDHLRVTLKKIIRNLHESALKINSQSYQ